MFQIILFIVWASIGTVFGELAPEGIVSTDQDSFFDPSIDYSILTARVTDRDDLGEILKVESESKNLKFLRSGDPLSFKINAYTYDVTCRGHVRSVEEHYAIISVRDLKQCWHPQEYFRRGTQITIQAPILSSRVKEASKYRLVLIERKSSYLSELNELNQFIWSYPQEKIKVAAQFDQRILEIERERQRALDDLVVKKNEASKLQVALSKKLDQIDQDLMFYRVERSEPLIDRWHLDQDLGHPVSNRPQPLKKTTSDATSSSRWHQKSFR